MKGKLYRSKYGKWEDIPSEIQLNLTKGSHGSQYTSPLDPSVAKQFLGTEITASNNLLTNGDKLLVFVPNRCPAGPSEVKVDLCVSCVFLFFSLVLEKLFC